MKKTNERGRQIVDLWSIAHALTTGIELRKGYELDDDGCYAYGKPTPEWFGKEQLKVGRDAFYTEADAKAAAIKKAEAKLKSMDKAAAKMRKLIQGWR